MHSLALLMCLGALGLPGATPEKGGGDLGKVPPSLKQDRVYLFACPMHTPCECFQIGSHRCKPPEAKPRESQPWGAPPRPQHCKPGAGRASDRGDSPHGVQLQGDAGAAQRVRHPSRVLPPMVNPASKPNTRPSYPPPLFPRPDAGGAQVRALAAAAAGPAACGGGADGEHGVRASRLRIARRRANLPRTGAVH